MRNALGSPRAVVGASFLLLQIGLVVWARTHRQIVPYWAPNDFLVDYQIQVTSPEGPLRAEQVQARFHIAPEGAWEYPLDALLYAIEHREAALGPSPPRTVTVRYTLNGGEARSRVFQTP